VQSSSQIITTSKPIPNLLHAGCPCCHITNSVRALKESITFHRLGLPSSPGCLPSIKGSRLPWGRLPTCQASRRPSGASTPNIRKSNCFERIRRPQQIKRMTERRRSEDIIDWISIPINMAVRKQKTDTDGVTL